MFTYTIWPTSFKPLGGSIAAPAVSQILSEVLPYLDIPSNDSNSSTTTQTINTPDVVNKTVAEAQKILQSAGLEYSTNASADDIVKEQVPPKGTALTEGGIVKLYVEGNDERVSQTVPDLKGVTFEQAKIMLKAKNLNIASTGSGIVIAQDPIAGTSVDEGTVINVTLQQETTQHNTNFSVGDGPFSKMLELSQSNMSIFHSQAGASSDPRRECENRYIVWRKQFFHLGPSPTEKRKDSNEHFWRNQIYNE